MFWISWIYCACVNHSYNLWAAVWKLPKHVEPTEDILDPWSTWSVRSHMSRGHGIYCTRLTGTWNGCALQCKVSHGPLKDISLDIWKSPGGVQSSQILPRQDFQKDSVANEMKVYFTSKNESDFPGNQSSFSQLMHKLFWFWWNKNSIWSAHCVYTCHLSPRMM